MDRERLQELSERYHKKADRAYRSYQDSGIQKYYRDYENADEMVDIISLALNALDEHRELISLRSSFSMCAEKARVALISQDAREIEGACKEIRAIGRMQGLIRKD